MSQCVAFGCFNRADSDSRPNNIPIDVSFHRFPLRKPDLLKQWEHNISRQGFKPTKNSRLCSAHFSPNCFKEDAYAKYGIHPEGTQKRLLKEDAVPTEFVHRHAHKSKRVSTVARLEKREQQRKIGELLSESSQKEITVCRESTSDSSTTAVPKLIGPSRAKKRKAAAETVTRAMVELEHESTEGTVFTEPESHVHPQTPTSVSRQQSAIPQLSSLYGTPRRTGRDHPYANRPLRSCATQTTWNSTVEQEVFIDESESSSPIQSPSRSKFGGEITDEEQLAEYLPSTDSSESSSAEKSGTFDPCKMKKYIVFEENLKDLHKFCKECGSPVTKSSKFTRGSMVGFKISCHSGHSYVWHSQPLDRKQPMGNLLIAAAILTSGSTYSKISAFADMLNLLLFSKTVYNKVQKQSILPVIQECWEEERRKATEEVKLIGSVVLAGDGRCDSPGHTAKYGSYTLMHTDGDGKSGTRKIVSMKLVQVSEVKNSNHMEPEGLKRCLKEVTDSGLEVGVLATDRHNMVTSMMKKDYKQDNDHSRSSPDHSPNIFSWTIGQSPPHTMVTEIAMEIELSVLPLKSENIKINHQFDTWHLAKGIVKKLTAKAKKKDCTDLAPWIQSISNHLWWACATCGEDKQVLREKWLSVLHHVTNNHKWSGNKKFHKCAHPTLSTADKKATKWLKPKSPAFVALKKIVTNTRLLNAMNHLTKFCHTGELEIFHSMLLKYCQKRQHFHYDAMSARLMLAAIDWNNTRREQKKDKSGKPATSVVYSKRRKIYVLKNRYGKAKSDHMGAIMKRIYEVHRDKVQLRGFDRPAELPRNVAKVPKPDKRELEEKFKSRFQ